MVDGTLRLHLPPEQQTRLGLVITPAREVSLSLAPIALGEVNDPAPLLEFRLARRQHELELAAAETRLAIAGRQQERQAALRKAGAVVNPDQLQAAELAYETARNEAALARAALEAVNLRARSRWGAALATRIQQNESPLAEALAQQSAQLLLCTLPADAADAAPPARFDYQLPGNANDRQSAEVLAPAPQTSAGRGGSWWALARDPHLRVGMRMELESASGEHRPGVAVPVSALLWHAGRRWVYVKRDEDSFERRAVTPERTLPGGQLAVEGLHAGEEAVSTGAQSLLGEELRWAIPTDSGAD